MACRVTQTSVRVCSGVETITWETNYIIYNSISIIIIVLLTHWCYGLDLTLKRLRAMCLSWLGLEHGYSRHRHNMTQYAVPELVFRLTEVVTGAVVSLEAPAAGPPVALSGGHPGRAPPSRHVS
jgi:hypothetical protein